MRREYFPLLAILLLAVFSPNVMLTSAKIGTGKLYVYIDDDYSTLAPRDDQGRYMVFSGQIVYIQIANISEFGDGDPIYVKICWEDHTKWYKSLTVKTLASGEGAGTIGVGDADDPIGWLVGEFEDGTYDIPYCETLTVHYTYAKEPEYLTTDPFDADPSMVAHLHSAIPEVPFGAVGSLTIILAGFILYVKMKNRF